MLICYYLTLFFLKLTTGHRYTVSENICTFLIRTQREIKFALSQLYITQCLLKSIEDSCICVKKKIVKISLKNET